MGPAGLPAVGSQARRKADGMLGEVYAADPPHNLLSVRWPTIPGAYGRADLTPDQFARAWELTGVQLPPPHETRAALGLIAFLVLLLFAVVLVRDSRSGYTGYDTYRPLGADNPAILNNAQALHDKYGMIAAMKCAGGADEYIRSVAQHRFHWDDTGMLAPRFDQFSPAVQAPGVLTMISGKASVSDGFGNFHPITVYCNFDTQSREVLSYAAKGVEH